MRDNETDHAPADVKLSGSARELLRSLLAELTPGWLKRERARRKAARIDSVVDRPPNRNR